MSSVNGIEVQVRDGRGPVLVMVHYWGGSARTWAPVIDRLPGDRAVVAFDQRGWSSSRGLPGPYGLHRLADDLLDVVGGLGDFVLVGHSMGAKVSQLAAARHPSGLAGLVLVAPAPARPPASITPQAQQMLSHAYDSAETVGQAIDHVLTGSPLDPGVRAAVIEDSLAAEAAAREVWPLEGIAEDITGAARAIEVPVLVLAGEHDRVEPPQVLRENLLPYLRDARFQVLPGTGHLIPLEAPGLLSAALEGASVHLG